MTLLQKLVIAAANLVLIAFLLTAFAFCCLDSWVNDNLKHSKALKTFAKQLADEISARGGDDAGSAK